MRARLLLPLLIVVTGVLAPPAATARPAAPGRPPEAPAQWVAPMGGQLVVTRTFRPPATPFASGHRGVDLGGTPGAVVRAAGDGVVVFAGMVAGRPVISIDHAGGLRTTYEPVTPSVAAGQHVHRGSPTGALSAGHAGCPRRACLHWGLRRGEAYLDPLALLEVPRIRLLPAA